MDQVNHLMRSVLGVHLRIERVKEYLENVGVYYAKKMQHLK